MGLGCVRSWASLAVRYRSTIAQGPDIGSLRHFEILVDQRATTLFLAWRVASSACGGVPAVQIKVLVGRQVPSFTAAAIIRPPGRWG
jgi:hypothetical protein